MIIVTTVKKIEIDTELLNKISKIAKKENTTENKIINQILKKGLENTEKEPLADKIERLSNGKVKMLNEDTYNPNSEKTRELIGIIKTKEPFDTAKAIREIRGIE